MRKRQLRDAKNRVSEPVRCAQAEEPQTVTVDGEPTAVVLAPDSYAGLVTSGHP